MSRNCRFFGTNALMAVNLINHKTKNKGKTMLIEQAPQLETERLLKAIYARRFPGAILRTKYAN